MKGRAPLRGLCLSLTLSALVGCAAGPNFKRPAAPSINRYTAEALPSQTDSAAIPLGVAQRFAEGRDLAAEWWTVFHSEALNSLVKAALQANPDLKAADAALRAARETTLAQKGAFFPTVVAGFNPTRQSTPGPGGSSIYSLDTAQLSISYVPDVFGVYRRQVESLSAQAEARRFEREATYVTLTSNIVAAAIQEASLRGQIDATHETIQLAQLQLEMTQRQRRAGQIGAAEVAIQEATVAQFQAALPPLEGALALQRHLLTILAGRFPSEEAGERFELAAFDLPAELPVSLPSRLVEQRPDVRAAEAQLQAASAQIGIAVANRLPAITLTASRGSQANEVSKLFKAGSGFWGVGAQVAETLFTGGALLHTQRAAEAAYEQAWAQYRSTVLRAFQNVADALTAIQNDATVLKAADTAEKAAEKSLKIARQQWMAGLTGYLGVQVAQLSYQQALLALIQAQASRLSDTAALFQALGGGWWNRSTDSSVASAQPKP